MIEFCLVSKRFDSQVVLDGLSFAVARGEIVFLIGRSGVGKSVCLKSLVGLFPIDSGKIRFGDTWLDALDEPGWLDLRRRCALIFQQSALIDTLSVRENLLLGVRSHRVCSGPVAEKNLLQQKLGEVGLDESCLDSMPQELSAGTQKRVSIARALAIGSEALLFDEPTTGLDPINTSRINALIESLGRAGRTVLVVSHDMQCALSVADRILLIDDAKVAVDTSPRAIRSVNHPLLMQFLEEADARAMA